MAAAPDLSTDLEPASSEALALPASLAVYARGAVELAAGAQRANTRRTYGTGWRAFEAFCDAHDVEPLPASPELVACFVRAASHGEHRPGARPVKASTLATYLAAIRDAHRRASEQPPTDHPLVAATLAGLRDVEQQAGQHRPDQAAPLLARHVRAIVDELDTETPSGARDAAVVLLGFAGGFRRAELAKLQLADLEWHDVGVRVWVRQSKTSKGSDGFRPGIDYKDITAHPSSPYCPVRALRRWLNVAGVEEGPVFRTFTMQGEVTNRAIAGRDVARTVKRCARLVGLDADAYSGHSLRAGFVTEHALRGHDNATIKAQTGHTDDRTVERYKRRHVAFRHDHAALLGLTS